MPQAERRTSPGSRAPAVGAGPLWVPLRALAALWRRFALEPMEWIDEHRELPEGRLDPTSRAMVVYGTAALSLTLISYGVLSGPVQTGAASALLSVLEWVSPALRADVQPYDPLFRNIAWSLGCFTCYFVIPGLVTRVILGHKLSDYGLSLEGYFKHLWIYVLLFIPVGVLVLLVARNPDFQQQYPFYKSVRGVGDFLVWEAFYALQFFSLEFFFRGFLLHGVRDKLGRFAIFAMVVPYVMIHFRKPLFETLGAAIAGTALGILSLRTRSVLGGFTIHVAVAISMDVASMWMRGF